ncbi:MAG: NAD-dependent epimerase/dehydratase family protein [Bacteroidetes bacterium]|nr:NAD-dependent epimerase/dehydratase family protein [Bacteroidota bacterium]
MNEPNTDPAGCSILLTGGAGFLGLAIVKELLAPGCPVTFSLLRIFDIIPYSGPEEERIESVTSDVRDAAAVTLACRGIDVVIHSAAIVDWGTRPVEEVYAVNYTGTENVVRACLEMGVKHLVCTSSLDAIYAGKPLVNIDENIPYPEKHPNMYCRSKFLAEKLVLETNGKPVSTTTNLKLPTFPPSQTSAPSPVSLTTCVLRPADVYGPADPFHIGSLISMAKGGFYVRLGNGTSLSQHVFVGNIAWAHILAIQALITGNNAVAGKAYFITDGPPSNFFKFFDAIVEGAGYRIRPKNIWIPRKIAFAMGAMAEFFALLIRPVKKYNPKFSRFAVLYTCSDFTFTSAKAARDFGFVSKYTKEEAFGATVKYYRLR